MPTKKAGLPSWKDDEYYDVQLERSTEFPPGSGKMIPVGAKLTMRGRAAKLIEKDIANAKSKSG
jgi:hypothetical protein